MGVCVCVVRLMTVDRIICGKCVHIPYDCWIQGLHPAAKRHDTCHCQVYIYKCIDTNLLCLVCFILTTEAVSEC